MTESPPLASPTLAQLYLSQGHLQRAREQVAALLSRNAHDGEALALDARLHTTVLPELELEADRALTLRWRIPPRCWSEGLHLVLSVVPAAPRWPTPHLLSGPATRARDAMSLPFPYASGSATACLTTLVGPTRALHILACAPAVTW